jgi:ABC-2 type transport system ATP-binding protein
MGYAIQLSGVRKSFGSREALKGIDLSVEEGDIFGYLGQNGAGKTTTIRILLDLIQPGSGTVSVMGERADRDSIRRRIGFVLDADGLYNAMTAQENLAFYAKLYGVEDAAPRIAARLADVGLADRAGDRVGGFSKGMRQRLALARALVHDPDVLILDEPMSGIDPTGQIELRNILLDVGHRGGKTIFFSSHDLDEVQRICNRIALIDHGEIRLQGPLADLVRQAGDGEAVIEVAAVAAPDGLQADGLGARLAAFPELGFVSAEGRSLHFKPRAGTEVSDIVGRLVALGVKVEGARRKEASLEELYASTVKAEGGRA